MTYLEKLSRFEARLVEARERERAAEVEVRERTTHLTRLAAERLEAERAIGGGAERDPKAEERFAELFDPHVHEQRQTYDTVWLDRRAQSRLDGAREARERAEQDLASFCDAHLTSLEDELRQGLTRDVATVLAAARDLAAALRPLHQRELRAARLWTLAGRGQQDEFVPGYDDLDEVRRVVQRLDRHMATRRATEEVAA